MIETCQRPDPHFNRFYYPYAGNLDLMNIHKIAHNNDVMGGVNIVCIIILRMIAFKSSNCIRIHPVAMKALN